VVVRCTGEEQQEQVFEMLKEQGYDCAVMSY
jgi:hypothetical protein